MTAAPHGILAVYWGPEGGTKAALRPGEALTVGRGEAAGLRLAHDEALAEIHFEVRWDGRCGELVHRAGPRLTLLDGQPIERSALGHGQWIRAGSSDLSFHIEALTPPQEQRDSPTRAAAERALAALRRDHGLVYALLDTARAPRIHELLRESIEPCRSLFEGTEGARLAEVAPHLVALATGSRLCADLVREGWGSRWGVWIVSDQPLVAVRRHLRKFTLVQLEAAPAPAYFRYYDPDVLRTYLDTCTPAERAQWFGDVIDEFIGEDVEAEDGWWQRPRATPRVDAARSSK
jgi:hypothetical protein